MRHRITTVSKTGQPVSVTTGSEDNAARLWDGLTGAAADRRALLFASWTAEVPAPGQTPARRWTTVATHAGVA
jgi:hypothetical protein